MLTAVTTSVVEVADHAILLSDAFSSRSLIVPVSAGRDPDKGIAFTLSVCLRDIMPVHGFTLTGTVFEVVGLYKTPPGCDPIHPHYQILYALKYQEVIDLIAGLREVKPCPSSAPAGSASSTPTAKFSNGSASSARVGSGCGSAACSPPGTKTATPTGPASRGSASGAS